MTPDLTAGAFVMTPDLAAGADVMILIWLQGLMSRNSTPPPGVVLLELQPHAMRAHGYEGGALQLLRKMHSWGYSDVSHSGYAIVALLLWTRFFNRS